MKTSIISEIGVNHDGSYAKLKKLILKSKIAGADFVKLQVYNTDEIVIKNTRAAEYQKKIDKNQYELLKKYELSKKNIIKINLFCKIKKIKLIATCFDIGSFNFCKKILNSSIYKIGSGDLTNLPLIYEIAKSKKKIILSTGMSNLHEIDLALKTVCYAYSSNNRNPTLKKIKNIKLNKIKLKFLKNKVSILHCVSLYPTKLTELNLNFISTLVNKYKLNIGFSDHSRSIFAPSIAVALGAKIIEKHFTLDNNAKGPDHSSSLNYIDFSLFVKKIRETELMLGSFLKKINSKEQQNAKIVKKSIYTKTNINIGEVFSLKNLSVKRPKKGKSPSFLWNLIGKKSKKKYKSNQLV
tara:strand:- start:17710 stop:18768 length:1059 start_codon:yes stop_codon:yes gene_type:complete